MVRVPIPQEPLQGGSIGSFRAFRTVPQRDATGAQITQLGRAATAAGTATASIADVLQDDLDVHTANEALALWNDDKRVTLYDPVTGYMNKQGKAATGEARVTTQNQIARSADNFSKNLDNDDQRSLFGTAVAAQTSQINQQMDVHEARAVRVFGIGEAKAMSEEAASNAVEEATLPVPNLLNFETQKKLSVRKANTVAEMLGYGPAQTDALILDTTTAIHTGVIDRLLKQGNPDTAQTYFEEVDKEEISSKVRTRLQGLMQTATMNDRAADQSTVIIDEVNVLSEELIASRAADQESRIMGQIRSGELDELGGAQEPPLRIDADDRLVEALRTLREKDMPEILRQATRQKLERHYRDEANREAAAMADVVSRSQLALAADMNLGPTDLPNEDKFELIRTGRWPAITQFARTGRFGGNRQAFATFMGLDNDALLAIESKEKLLLNLGDMGMTPTQQNTVVSAWEGARTGGGATPTDRAVTIGQRMVILAKQHGLADDNGTITDHAVYDAIQLEANKRVAQEDAKPAGKIFGEELNNTLNSAFIDMFVTLDPGPGLFALGFIPTFGLTQGERLVLRSQLTPEQRTREGTVFGRGGEAFRDITLQDGTEERLSLPVNDHIVRRLRAEGTRVTNKAILEVWEDLGRPATLEGVR